MIVYQEYNYAIKMLLSTFTIKNSAWRENRTKVTLNESQQWFVMQIQGFLKIGIWFEVYQILKTVKVRGV